MRKNYKIIILLVILFMFLMNSMEIINNLLEYNNLFYKNIFPTSFIIYTISTLLIDYNILSFIPINITNIYIFLLSLISGFPSGSKYTKYLYDKKMITKEEANNLITFSHFPNLLFVLGPITQIINDRTITMKLLLSIIISNCIIMIFSKKSKTRITNNNPSNFSQELSNAITNTSKTILLIYGTSVFFYLVSTIIIKYTNQNIFLYVLISGLFDLTKGIFSTSIINNTIVKSLLILFFLSFGSISIHMQVKSILGKDLSYRYFLLGRIISTILSFTIFILIK